jgi:geranylgeranyl pyrophosphate synthase
MTGSVSSLAAALRAHAPDTARAPASLRAAVDDALARPGRLVRATLLLASAEAADVPVAAAEPLACAVEYWHLASLLLDDLPCMDDAGERRGQPCVHRVHGESSAILAALALINRAYTLTGTAFARRPVAVRRRALALVETVMGPAGIVGGQAADLAFADGPRSPADIGRIAWRKTGSLLWLCLALPALWNRPARVDTRQLRRVALYWGLAYQAIDDLGDVLATTAQTGKTARRDAALARPNLALALGVPAAHRRIARLLDLAGATIARLVAADPRQAYLLPWHEAVFVARGAALRAA